MEDELLYRQKYIKYKTKYALLKGNQQAGEGKSQHFEPNKHVLQGGMKTEQPSVIFDLEKMKCSAMWESLYPPESGTALTAASTIHKAYEQKDSKDSWQPRFMDFHITYTLSQLPINQEEFEQLIPEKVRSRTDYSVKGNKMTGLRFVGCFRDISNKLFEEACKNPAQYHIVTEIQYENSDKCVYCDKKRTCFINNGLGQPIPKCVECTMKRDAE
jgi:hypothetical protein